MILALCLFLLPLAFAAVLQPGPNRFDKFDDLFIMQTFLKYLPIQERVKFMLTCREYYQFIDSEYDQVLKQFSGSQTSYKEASEELKAEVKTIFKYLFIESKQPFNPANFYRMIEGSYLTDQNSRDSVKSDNNNAYKPYYGRDYDGLVRFDIPHFPHMSLQLLKSQRKDEELSSLIQNACVSPHRFDAFFKHLAFNIYKIKREQLPQRIRDQYPLMNFPVGLETYQNILGVAFIMFSQETLGIFLILLAIAYQFIPSEWDPIFYNGLVILFILDLQLLVQYYYCSLWALFGEFSPAALRRFSLFCDNVQRFARFINENRAYWRRNLRR